MKLFVTLFLILILHSLNAQIKSGVIHFEEVKNNATNKLETESEVPEAVLALLNSRKHNVKKQLRFTETKSVYENYIETKEDLEVEPQDPTNGIVIMRVTSGGSDREKS